MSTWSKAKKAVILYTRPDDLKTIKVWSPTFVAIACIFCACLMISNLAAGKLVQGPFGLLLDGGAVMFPIIYIFGDVLTEVYGFKRSRLIIWMGLICNLLMALLMAFVVALPAPDFYTGQSSYELIFSITPVIVIGSMVGYFFGEMTNSIVLSKMKKRTQGKHLWSRTISSTIVGEAVDTFLFELIAFGPFGFWFGWDVMLQLFIVGYLWKVIYEIVATPLTYKVVGYVKRKEKVDIYDYGVQYNPFTLKE